MKKIIMVAGSLLPAHSDPIKEDEFFTPHAQGCMLLQECTDHVQELKTVSDLNKHEELILITVLLLMSLISRPITYRSDPKA